jgi:HEAT repeat protein
MRIITSYASAVIMQVMQTAGVHRRLLQLLQDECAELRRQAAEVLGNLGRAEPQSSSGAFYTAGEQMTEAIQALLVAVADAVPEVRKAAVVALGHFCYGVDEGLARSYPACNIIAQQPGAVDKLVQLLSSEDAGMREKAAFTISNLCLGDAAARAVGTPSTIALLLSKLEDSVVKVYKGESELAASAIANLVVCSDIARAVYGMPEAMATMRRLAAAQYDDPSISWELRREAERALKNISIRDRASGVSTSHSTTSFTADNKDPSQQMVDNAAEVAVKQATRGKLDALSAGGLGWCVK